METLTIEVKSKNGYKILKELEKLDLIRIFTKKTSKAEKLSYKYSGVIPSIVADELSDYVTKSRNEWEINN